MCDSLCDEPGNDNAVQLQADTVRARANTTARDNPPNPATALPATPRPLSRAPRHRCNDRRRIARRRSRSADGATLSVQARAARGPRTPSAPLLLQRSPLGRCTSLQHARRGYGARASRRLARGAFGGGPAARTSARSISRGTAHNRQALLSTCAHVASGSMHLAAPGTLAASAARAARSYGLMCTYTLHDTCMHSRTCMW